MERLKEQATLRFDYRGADSAIAINRLLKAGARITMAPLSNASRQSTYALFYGIPQRSVESIAKDTGIKMFAHQRIDSAVGLNHNNWPLKLPMPAAAWPPGGSLGSGSTSHGRRTWMKAGLAGCSKQYEFAYTTLHNAAIKDRSQASGASAGLSSKLREKFDVIILPDQQARDIVNGFDFKTVREEIAEASATKASKRFASLYAREALDLWARAAIRDRQIPHPVRNLSEGSRREQTFRSRHNRAGTVDASHPLGYGLRLRLTAFTTTARSLRWSKASHLIRLRWRCVIQLRCSGIRLVERRRVNGGPCRGGVGGNEPGPHRVVRVAASASSADSRDVPAVVQRAIHVSRPIRRNAMNVGGSGLCRLLKRGVTSNRTQNLFG